MNVVPSTVVANQHLTITGSRFSEGLGIATDERGTTYVAEWLIGGRFTKLVGSTRNPVGMAVDSPYGQGDSQ